MLKRAMPKNMPGLAKVGKFITGRSTELRKSQVYPLGFGIAVAMMYVSMLQLTLLERFCPSFV